MKKLEDKHTPAPDRRWKGKFPEGLRVLAVDDNVVCLRLLKAFLLQCRYKVTATTEASTALKLLRESKNHDKFDIVITDVHMLDMDGFRLLEIIGHEMDLPVIMMSSNDVHHTVMKGVEHGACDYLLKPIRLGEIKNIWQHVVRKNKFDAKNFLISEKGIADQTSRPQKRPMSQNCKREDGTSLQRDEHSSSEKKPRLVWCNELSAKFIDAYNKLGKDNAVASKILELMNVPNLTREQVASHLQKHRKNLQKSESEESKTKISCNRRDGEPRNTTILSFEGQHHIALNVYNSFGVNGYSTPAATHFIRHVQHPYSITQSQVNPRPVLLPLNQQNVVLPQCSQSVEVLGQNCQQIKVPRLGVFPSHSLTMENMHVQSCFSRPKYQPFPSETKGCNGGMEISPNFASYQKSSEQCSSDFPLLEEDAILSNNDDDDDDFTRNYQMILGEFSSEPLEADNNFSLNSSSSFDDLDAAIKQFRH